MLPWVLAAGAAFYWLYNKGVGQPAAKKPAPKALPAPAAQPAPETVNGVGEDYVPQEQIEKARKAVPAKAKKPAGTPVPEPKKAQPAAPARRAKGSLDDIMPDGVGVEEFPELDLGPGEDEGEEEA